MPKRFSDKSFERDVARARVLFQQTIAGTAAGGTAENTFAQVMAGYDSVAGDIFVGQGAGGGAFVYMGSADIRSGYSSFIVNTSGSLTFTPSFYYFDGSSGTVRIKGDARKASAGNNQFVAQTSTGWQNIAMPNNGWSAVARYDMTGVQMTFSVTAGDIVHIEVQRDGNSASDTFGNYIGLMGWKIS